MDGGCLLLVGYLNSASPLVKPQKALLCNGVCMTTTLSCQTSKQRIAIQPLTSLRPAREEVNCFVSGKELENLRSQIYGK